MTPDARRIPPIVISSHPYGHLPESGRHEGRDDRPLRSHRFGPYTLQAAIAAVHAEAPAAAATDWAQIVGLFDALLRSDPSPIVELSRAAAVAMRDGPA